jgi:hypothetical protein
MSGLGTVPLAVQIACVQREIDMRHRVYARRVDENRMSAKKAEEEILTMGAVLESLKELAAIKARSDR